MTHRIFISYSSFENEIAGKIKRSFEEYKIIECFLAHDDIEPGSEWEKEILANLNLSNYFMPIQTKNLIASFWCQQEVGYALAKEIKIIPLKLDTNYIDPIGFYSKFQGFKLKTNNLKSSIKQLLLREKIIQQNNSDKIEKIIYIFSNSNTWKEAYQASQKIMQIEDDLTDADIIRIVDIAIKNDQIRNSFDARNILRDFFSRHSDIITTDKIKVFI